MKLWKLILAALHVHVWRASAWNRFCWPVEQTCRCSARRHVKEFVGPFSSEWHAGPHPMKEANR